jgi:hypothetical protein
MRTELILATVLCIFELAFNALVLISSLAILPE